MTRDDLIRDAAWDDVAITLPTSALPVGGIPGRKTVPPVVPPVVAPEPDEPRHVGDLPAPTARGYGIAFTLARNAWKRATTTEGETA